MKKETKSESTSSTQKPLSVDSYDLTPRERVQVSGKWVIVSYGGQADARSAADNENEAWELFLDRCTAPKLKFIKDGFKAVQMP